MTTRWPLVLVLAAACGVPAREQSDAAPAIDVWLEEPGEQCPAGNNLVYVIDELGDIYRFDPQTKELTLVGHPTCPGLNTGPFSMSIDRSGRAWILYQDYKLYRFHMDALESTCRELPWTSPYALRIFGMGFSTDVPGGATESLFVAGNWSRQQPAMLTRVDPITLEITPIASQTGFPEMTGNANAELWGFFPSLYEPRVVRFDKTDGGVHETFVVPELKSRGSDSEDFAFAHWGGHYWIFLRKDTEPSTQVYEIDGTTGAIVSMTPTQLTIVGAGVSTCAPTVIN